MSTALARTEQQTKTIAAFLMSEDRLAKLQKALPPGINITAGTVVRIFLNSLQGNAKLLEASMGNQSSLWSSLVEAATLGLKIGGPLPQGYLVPYAGTVQFQLSYHGLIELCQRSGKLSKIVAMDVREGDTFLASEDPLDDSPIIHKKSTKADRHKLPITHVWAGAALKDSSRCYLAMTTAEIDDHKKRYSQGWDRKGSAWKEHWEAMAKKTVLLKLIRDYHLPMDIDDQRRDQYIPPVEPVAGEITAGEEWALFQNYAAECMGKAEDVTAVNSIEEQLHDEYQGEAHAAYIREIANTKRDAIRSTRGENST